MFSNPSFARIGRSIAIFAIALSLLLGTAVPPGMAKDLPVPDPEFHGTITETYVNSEADESILLPPVEPPEDSPNVVLILLDDVGFGASETFGGQIHTPTLNRLAENGLSYNRFHTTALCSPTRAALLTGRNHHSASTGALTDFATGFPGYTGIIPQDTATIAQILQGHGYNTAWIGKNHNLPGDQGSNAGPFTRWPNDLGFDYFYGFLGGGGETDQWYPALYENRNPINQPSYPDENDLDNSYNLTRDLADKAISWVRYNHTLSPETPFFLYFAPGATHAPHHPPPSYTTKYQAEGEHAIAAEAEDGMFTEGWDKLQQATCIKQKAMGIIPRGTQCTERPEEILAWEDSYFDYPIGDEDKYRDLMTLQMQTYAGFLEYTDVQVGRTLAAIEELGELDNTLVIYIVGDNGSSAEGGLIGGCNMSATYAGLDFTMNQNLACKNKWGHPGTTPHFAVGWAWATDAPFRWTKQIASYFGGTRNPMVVSWPDKIHATGNRRLDLRDQFLHVIDVAPTILDVVGIDPPDQFNDIFQKPIEGASFANTFEADGAEAPALRDTQYFEMVANRGIYHDGWMASSFHGQLPWETNAASTLEDDPELEKDEWELFDLESDFSQSTDLSGDMQDKLEEMKELFDSEAKAHDVYPIDDRFFERAALDRPTVFGERTYFEFYPGAIFLPGDIAPNVAEYLGYVITADLNITEPDKVQGVIFASGGGDTGGYSLYVNKKHHLVFEYKYLNLKRTRFVSETTLPEGPIQVAFVFDYNQDDEGQKLDGSGHGYLYVNNELVDDDDIEKTFGGDFMMDSQDVGMDMRAPVGRYEPPFEFTGGEIKKVTLDIDPSGEGLASPEPVQIDSSPEEVASESEASHQEFIDRVIQEIVERLGS
ncbi:MAG: arylsulfatase [Cyanobacteria bacterium P01_E01_bin.42]